MGLCIRRASLVCANVLVFCSRIAATTGGDVKETESGGTGGFLGGRWRIWGWPLLVSHKVGEVVVQGDLAQWGIPLALLRGKRLIAGCWGQRGAPREANGDPAFAKALPAQRRRQNLSF